MKLDILLPTDRTESSESSEKRALREPSGLSPAQERTWFLEQAYPQHPFHTVALGLRISGLLDHRLLDQAITEVFTRHRTLRCAFGLAEGFPKLRVVPPPPSLLAEDDVSEHSQTDEWAATCRRWISAWARTPFDVSIGPLLRVRLLTGSARERLLLLAGHRIVCDNESLEIIAHEIVTLYECFSRGRRTVHDVSSESFADFVDWQRQNAASTDLSAYWKRALAGAPTVLDLPSDYPRPAVQALQGESAVFVLPDGVAAALRGFCHQRAIDPDAVLLTAFSILLQRNSAQDELLVGVRSSYRAHSKWAKLVGPLENTLVVRCQLAGDPPASDLLLRVGARLREARAHSDLPFEQLIKNLQPGPQLGRSPLVQAMFAFRDTPLTVSQTGELTIQPFAVDTGVSSCDLSLSLVFKGNSLSGALIYDPALFAAASIERMIGQYGTLLADFLVDSDRPISTLRTLTEAERHQVLVKWNDTETPYDTGQCIHELIEHQVEQLPDAAAVVFRSDRLSYRELNTRANRLAHYLRALGVGPEVLVPVYMDRGPDMVVAILAILKAGGAYVPLDASYPKARLLTIVATARAPVLVTHEALAFELELETGRIVCLDRDAAQIDGASPENPSKLSSGENPAFALFTSGSTGNPKGVLVTHGNLVNYRLLWERECGLSHAVSAICQMAFFSFAVFQGDVIRALCSGKKLILCPREALQSPSVLYALMKREAADFAEFVPALLRNLVAFLHESGERLDFMRVVVVGADRWYWREHLDASRHLGQDTRFIHVYGSSETTLDSTRFEHSELALRGDQPTPIGRPFTNVRAYILDADLRPLPVGEEGELCIGGAGVARGYLNLPELSAAKFVADPFVEARGARMFRTGDLAKWLPDGNIAFLGRRDQQVKINGFRIELGEIEAALERHPQIDTGLVQATEQEPGSPQLVAYYLPRPRLQLQLQLPTPAELRRFLATTLPDFMMPTHFVMLESLPLTPSGKINRSALPAPMGCRPELETPYTVPRNDVEQAIADVWRKVLRVEQVGANDNFFDLGGSSILMVQANLQLRQILRRNIAIIQMYQYPTIASLAYSLAEVTDASAAVKDGKTRSEMRRGLMTRRQQAGLT